MRIIQLSPDVHESLLSQFACVRYDPSLPTSLPLSQYLPGMVDEECDIFGHLPRKNTRVVLRIRIEGENASHALNASKLKAP